MIDDVVKIARAVELHLANSGFVIVMSEENQARNADDSSSSHEPLWEIRVHMGSPGEIATVNFTFTDMTVWGAYVIASHDDHDPDGDWHSIATGSSGKKQYKPPMCFDYNDINLLELVVSNIKIRLA